MTAGFEIGLVALVLSGPLREFCEDGGLVVVFVSSIGFCAMFVMRNSVGLICICDYFLDWL